MENKALLVQRWDNLPSQAEFAKVEDGNVPAVFVGALTSWPAYKLWDPSGGGLQHLKAIAGSAIVQAMATNSGTNFYGDIRSHERVPIRFDTFLSLANSAGACGDGKGIQSNLNNEEEFYKRIYGVFDNPHQAMASMLDGKEAFAAAVLKRVMDRYLGLNCTPVQN